MQSRHLALTFILCQWNLVVSFYQNYPTFGLHFKFTVKTQDSIFIGRQLQGSCPLLHWNSIEPKMTKDVHGRCCCFPMGDFLQAWPPTRRTRTSTSAPLTASPRVVLTSSSQRSFAPRRRPTSGCWQEWAWFWTLDFKAHGSTDPRICVPGVAAVGTFETFWICVLRILATSCDQIGTADAPMTLVTFEEGSAADDVVVVVVLLLLWLWS